MDSVGGKVAFITGGASGVGLGMAKAFTRAGMKVAIADVREAALAEAMATPWPEGAEVLPVRLDVTDRSAMSAAADETERRFGKVHVLCNNAGLGVTGPIKEATFDDWDWLLGVMLGGAVNGVQTFLSRIRRHGEGGHIVNTASVNGVIGSSKAGIYSTAKYALVGMAESLHGELRDEHIGASAFLAGPMSTNLAWSHELRPAGLSTGYDAYDKRRAAFVGSNQDPLTTDGAPLLMDPLEAGERVLRGILRNDLYIICHPEVRDGLVARNEALLRAVPDEAPHPERRRTFANLILNPIYDAQTQVPAFAPPGKK